MISVPPAGGPRFRPWGENRDPPSGSASETNNDRQIKFELIHVIALGPSGTGKTHVALGLGLAACQRGLAVGFVTAAALVHELLEARDERRPPAAPPRLQAHLAHQPLDAPPRVPPALAAQPGVD